MKLRQGYAILSPNQNPTECIWAHLTHIWKSKGCLMILLRPKESAIANAVIMIVSRQTI